MHRLDARSKLIVLAVYSVSLFFVDSWSGMFCYTALFAIALACSRLPCGRVFAIAIPVYVLALFTVAAHAFAFSQGAVHFEGAGFEQGLFFALRILLLIWASLIVCFSTSSTQLTDAFIWFLKPLARLKLPVDDIAMVFSIALRFIPVTAAEYENVRRAQWSRCAPFDEGGIAARCKAYGAIFIPLFVGLFRRADNLALAMDARCYGMPGVRRTALSESHMRSGEGAATVLLCAVLIAGAVFL